MSKRSNDIPEGLKMTELGSFPQEWSTAKLDGVLREMKDRNRSGEQLPVYSVSNVHGFILSDSFFDRQVYSRDLGTYKVVCKGDFAYNPYRINVGSLGLFLHEGRCLVSPAYVVFRIERSELIDYNYLYLLLKSYQYAELIKKYSMSRGSVRRSLSYRDLSQFAIPVPPLAEQQTIAGVLSSIQKAIEAQDKVSAAARETKKSLMRHLFTYGPVPVADAEKVPLKETEIGPVPQHWEVVRLADMTSEEIRNGAFVRRDRFGSGVPFLNVADTYGDISIDLRSSERVEATRDELDLYAIEPNDLFYVRSSLKREGVGQCCIVENVAERSIYDCHLMRVRVDIDRVVPRYLAYYSLSSPGRESLISRSKTTTMTTINQQGLSGFILPLPSYGIQKEIADILASIDTKLKIEEERKASLQSLFKAMLHQLMTGRLRVKNLEGTPG